MVYAILILLMIVLFVGIKYVKNVQEKKQLLQDKISKVNLFLQEIELYRNEYFTYSIKVDLIERYEGLYRECKNHNNEKIKEFLQIYSNLEDLRKEWNKEYVNKELSRSSDLLSNIDGKSLDNQQRMAVVVDEDNTLILAGAGSGKTLTISGKVKYLVDLKNINPKEILLISFTRKAAQEMTARISDKLNIDIESKTFHKLGLDIIKQKRKKSPDISDDLNDFIDKYFKNVIYKDEKKLKSLIDFYGYYINIPPDIDNYDNIGEYYKRMKHIDYTTLKGKQQISQFNKENEEILKNQRRTIKGERVKSLEEVMIANYLYLNNVEYVYEKKYPYDIKDNYRKHYSPDFYLPEYDIYIEHFGVNEYNKAPQLSPIEEKKYIEGMDWKRKLHRQNNTVLVETYSYYNSQGILLQELRRKLSQLGVEFGEVDYREVYDTIITNKEDKYFKELRKLISTFINLFKSRGYKLDKFDEFIADINKMKNPFNKQRNLLFMNMVKDIYQKYEEYLEENSKIDFNDMIIESTNIIKNDEVKFDYKYIIIDEYQDISQSRFNLIKEIKRQTNAKLMCVGDDWQSIYRFAGSDINLFTDFGKYVGYYELLRIEKTYRNSQSLIDIAGKFVMKNDEQLVKNLKSDKKYENPINIIGYMGDILQAVEGAIEDIVSEFGSDSNIIILGRNNFDIKMLQDKHQIEQDNNLIEIKKKDERYFVKYKKYPKLKIEYLTVHKSKGLEGENVIIINLENKIAGFPNQMTDDPVLDFVLTRQEDFELAEERRLFYVALTRTKNKCYLIVPEMNSSIFCDELQKAFKIKVKAVSKENISENPKCPKCKDGILVKRRYKDREFLGCSNYPLCDFTSNSLEILEHPIVCEVCGGYMVERNRYGRKFLGCTNYPVCKNTKECEEAGIGMESIG